MIIEKIGATSEKLRVELTIRDTRTQSLFEIQVFYKFVLCSIIQSWTEGWWWSFLLSSSFGSFFLLKLERALAGSERRLLALNAIFSAQASGDWPVCESRLKVLHPYGQLKITKNQSLAPSARTASGSLCREARLAPIAKLKTALASKRFRIEPNPLEGWCI